MLKTNYKWPLLFTLLGLTFIGLGYFLTTGIRVGKPEIPGLDVMYRPINAPEDILAPEGKKVPPVAYTKATSLAELPVDEKKEKFFHMLLPAVLISQHKLEKQREQVRTYKDRETLDEDERTWLSYMLDKYRAEDAPTLLRRMESHPVSIVLAQAAIETGWGSSRFFREANNIFGVWSFNPDEPRIKSLHGRGDRDVYLKKYDSLNNAVDDYFLTIGRGPYKDFRSARLNSSDPLELVRHLTKYSELGQEYVRRLQQLIRYNNLTRFDAYQLDLEYRHSTTKEG